MSEYVYTQHNNEVKVRFLENATPKNLAMAAKIEIELFAKKIDPISRVAPTAKFDTVTHAAMFDIGDMVNGNLVFKPDASALGALTGSKYYGRFAVYSADFPSGIVWAKAHDDLFEFVVSG